jgi:hypothetical protein
VTRLLALRDGTVRTVDDGRIGEVLGIAYGRLVAYGPCHGLPCPVVAVDPATGTVLQVAPSAGLVRVVDRTDGPAIAFENPGDGSIRVVDIAGRERLTVPAAGDGRRLVPPAHFGQANVDVPRGWLATGPDGRPGVGSRADLRLIDADDGRSLPAAEVIP